ASSARAPERSPAARFASASVARMRGSYHSAARLARASAGAGSSVLVAVATSPAVGSAAARNAAASTGENGLPRPPPSSRAAGPLPRCGAPGARERERGLERARSGGDVAGGELGGAEKRGGLDTGERTAALFRQLGGTAAVSERAGEIAPQPQHLAQESVRPVQGFESPVLLVSEERFQARLSFGRSP